MWQFRPESAARASSASRRAKSGASSEFSAVSSRRTSTSGAEASAERSIQARWPTRGGPQTKQSSCSTDMGPPLYRNRSAGYIKKPLGSGPLCGALPRWRDGRVAEGTPLLRAHRGKTLSRVRIPLSPPSLGTEQEIRSEITATAVDDEVMRCEAADV